MAEGHETSRQALARKGETLAAQYLEQVGLEIVARNARTRWGEIDLVARDGETWVFVEVKTRSSSRFGAGAEAVTWSKRQKIILMARILLARLALHEVPVRFDVVEVSMVRGKPQLRHLAGAFDA